jgi:hypothetical protein
MINTELLTEIYDNLANATIDYQKSTTHTIQSKDVLETTKLSKLATGEIQGKNEGEREAKAREILRDLYENYSQAQRSERNAKLSYDLACLRVDQFKLELRLIEVTSITSK